ncbi:hypothetical protein INR49_024327 [Caranx melampygus]|nr:hypothetical protein INR49_024327 [Caranx melampygus]
MDFWPSRVSRVGDGGVDSLERLTCPPPLKLLHSLIHCSLEEGSSRSRCLACMSGEGAIEFLSTGVTLQHSTERQHLASSMKRSCRSDARAMVRIDVIGDEEDLTNLHKLNGHVQRDRNQDLAKRRDETRRDERTGQDRTGQDRTGQDRAGQDRTGQDRAGQNGGDRTKHM